MSDSPIKSFVPYLYRMQSDKYPKNYWKGILVLIPLYTMAQLIYYLPLSYFPKQIKNFPLSPVWILIPIIFLTGAWILKNMAVSWMLGLWKWVHLSLIIIVFVILIGNKVFENLSSGILAAIRPMIEFMISPILYIALGIMYRLHKLKGL